MQKDKTSKGSKSYNTAVIAGDHIPRIVRLIKANPGLTATQLYNLRPFSFKKTTLAAILVAAKARGEVYFEKSKNVTEEGRYYVCPTQDTTEEVDGN